MIPETFEKLSVDEAENVLNIFHEWKSLDHSFEEIRVALRNAKKGLSTSSSLHKKIDEILDDDRVQGSELNLSHKVNMGDQHVGLYLMPDRVVPIDVPVNIKESAFSDSCPFVMPFLFHNAPEEVLFVALSDHRIEVLRLDGKTLVPYKNLLSFHDFKSYLRQTAISEDALKSGDYDEFDVNKIGLSKESLENKRHKIMKMMAHRIPNLVHSKKTQIYIAASSKYMDHAKESFSGLIAKNPCKFIEFDVKDKNIRNPNDLMSLIDEHKIETPQVEYKNVLDTNDPAVVQAFYMENKIESLVINEGLLKSELAKMNNLHELKVINRLIFNMSKRSIHLGVAPTEGLFRISSNRPLNMQDDRYFPVDENLAAACKTLWASYINSLI